MHEDLIKKLRTHNGWALNETLNEAANIIEELTIQNEVLRNNIIDLMWETEEKKIDVMKIKGENIMDEEVVFIKQKDIGELILDSLFSEETEKFYNNCAFWLVISYETRNNLLILQCFWFLTNYFM